MTPWCGASWRRTARANTYTAEVAIVRVLRGQHLLADIPAISDDEYGERRVYNVSNFGDKIMCYADVDEGATYVLFVTTYDGRLSAKYDDIFGAATRYNDDAENEALEAQGKATESILKQSMF